MARDSSGTQNQPQYSGAGAPSDAADLSEVANYAALVGNRKTGTDSTRTGLTGADVWDGLEFFCTDTHKLWVHDAGTWTFIYQVPTGWIALPLATGWTATGGGWAAPAYRLNQLGETEIRGQMAPKSGYANTDIFATLPVGFRPTGQIAPPVMNNGGGLGPAIAELVITAAGDMSLVPAGVLNVNFGALTFATV